MNIKNFDEFQKDKILYIFDFDETLVLNPKFEELAIEYLKEDINIKTLLSTSIKKIKVDLKSLKWENGKIYVNDPEEQINVNGNWVRKNKRVYLIPPDKFYFTDLSLPNGATDLKDFYNSVVNKAIVTARPNDMKTKVIESLEKFKLDVPNKGLYCYPKYQKSVFEWKAKTIINLIKKCTYKYVHFYDDNSKLVNYVTVEVKRELPNIKWKGIKYKHGKL